MTQTDALPMTDEEIEALLRRGDEDDEPRFTNGYRREPHLFLKETGDSAIVRPLMDSKDWFRARTHKFVNVTKPKPEGYEGKWPEMMTGTCRKEPLFKKLYPGGCPLCASPLRNKFDKTMEESAQELRYTLAVEREEVTGDGSPEMGGPELEGKKGWQDKMIKVPVFDDKGEPIKDQFELHPSIVIISGTMFQMFAALKALGEAYDGTLKDRDYRVKRVPNPNPSSKGDIFVWIPLTPIDAIKPGTDHWDTYLAAIKAWTPTGLNLARIIVEKSSEEFYDRFFTTDGVYVVPQQARPRTGGFSVASTPSVSTPSEAPDADKLAAMRARVLSQQPAAAAQAPADQAPATEG
jgi:hypothetical protein